ncbi:MAG: sugar ABC transporter substrate-binding protein [Solirubrobacteraceae bacterium]
MKAKHLPRLALMGMGCAIAVSACGSTAGTEAAESKATKSQSVIANRSWNDGGSLTIPIPKPNSGKGVKIAFTGFGQNNPYSQWIFKAIAKEAKKFGASATFVGPPSFEEQGQYEVLSDIAQAKSYNAVIMLPINGAQIVPAVEKLITAGIKVATVSEIVGPKAEANHVQVPGITTEVFAPVVVNAEVMGKGVIDACTGLKECEVDVLWGDRSLSFDHAKLAPFKATISGHPNIKIVCESDANYTQQEGRTEAAACLQAHPNVHVVASQADESARGAEGAIEAAGKTVGLGRKDITIIGSYASRYGVKKVREGKWLQTWYARPESMGFTATDLVLRSLEGKKVPNFIRQEELDGLGSVLTKKTLEANPQILGQWEG